MVINSVECIKSSPSINNVDSRPHQISIVLPYGRNKQLRKTIRADGTQIGADDLTWVTDTSRTNQDLPSIHKFFSLQIGLGLNAAICYGRAVGKAYQYWENEDGTKTKSRSPVVHRREWYQDGKRESGFVDVPSDLLFIDIDDAPQSDMEDWISDPDSAVQAMIFDNLPEFMHDVSFVWMWTASHGKNPDMLRVRLIYQLDKVICAGERKQLLAALHAYFDPVDAGIYGPERLIYFARPLFEEGARDPLKGLRLTGFVKAGEDKLAVPGALWLN